MIVKNTCLYYAIYSHHNLKTARKEMKVSLIKYMPFSDISN